MKSFNYKSAVNTKEAAKPSFIAGRSDIPPAKKVARPVASFDASFVFVADLKLKLFIFITQAAAFFDPFFFKAFQTFSAVAGI